MELCKGDWFIISKPAELPQQIYLIKEFHDEYTIGKDAEIISCVSYPFYDEPNKKFQYSFFSWEKIRKIIYREDVVDFIKIVGSKNAMTHLTLVEKGPFMKLEFI